MEKITGFDDWKDLFYKWQKDIGFGPALVKDYKFDAFYDEGTGPDIEFGDYKGRKKFAKLLDVPTQDMRDALLHLIFYQGDTEFGSSEQQRKLIDTAPSDYDRQCLLRVMREEQRHGWQMCHVLINNFGDSGKLEARKLLDSPRLRGHAIVGRVQQARRELHRFRNLYLFYRSGWQIPAHDAAPFQFCAVVAQYGADVERRSVSFVHRSNRTVSHCESRQGAR